MSIMPWIFLFFLLAHVSSANDHEVVFDTAAHNATPFEDRVAIPPKAIASLLFPKVFPTWTDGKKETWKVTLEWTVPDAPRETMKLELSLSFSHLWQGELDPLFRCAVDAEMSLHPGKAYPIRPFSLQVGFRSSGTAMWLLLPKTKNSQEHVAFRLPHSAFLAIDAILRQIKVQGIPKPRRRVDSDDDDDDITFGTPFDRIRHSQFSSWLIDNVKETDGHTYVGHLDSLSIVQWMDKHREDLIYLAYEWIRSYGGLAGGMYNQVTPEDMFIVYRELASCLRESEIAISDLVPDVEVRVEQLLKCQPTAKFLFNTEGNVRLSVKKTSIEQPPTPWEPTVPSVPWQQFQAWVADFLGFLPPGMDNPLIRTQPTTPSSQPLFDVPTATPSSSASPSSSADSSEPFSKMSVKDLQQYLSSHNVSWSDCTEKRQLVARARAHAAAAVWEQPYRDGTRSAVVPNGTEPRLTSHTLHSLEAAWCFSAEDPINRHMAFSSGILVFSDQGGVAHALDAKTGKKLWSFSWGARSPMAPVIVGGIVIFGVFTKSPKPEARGAAFCALDLQTGQERWRLAGPENFPHGPWSMGLDAKSGVFVGVFGHPLRNSSATAQFSLIAFSISSQSVAWKIDVEKSKLVPTGAVFFENRGYWSYNDKVVCFSSGDGVVIWERKAKLPPGAVGTFLSLSPDGNFLVRSTTRGAAQTVVLTASDGVIQWTSGVGFAHKAVTNAVVYALSDSSTRFVALDLRTGHLLWQSGVFHKHADSTLSPGGVIVNDVFISSHGNECHIFNAATGDLVYRAFAGASIPRNASVAVLVAASTIFMSDPSVPDLCAYRSAGSTAASPSPTETLHSPKKSSPSPTEAYQQQRSDETTSTDGETLDELLVRSKASDLLPSLKALKITAVDHLRIYQTKESLSADVSDELTKPQISRLWKVVQMLLSEGRQVQQGKKVPPPAKPAPPTAARPPVKSTLGVDAQEKAKQCSDLRVDSAHANALPMLAILRALCNQGASLIRPAGALKIGTGKFPFAVHDKLTDSPFRHETFCDGSVEYVRTAKKCELRWKLQAQFTWPPMWPDATRIMPLVVDQWKGHRTSLRLVSSRPTSVFLLEMTFSLPCSKEPSDMEEALLEELSTWADEVPFFHQFWVDMSRPRAPF